HQIARGEAETAFPDGVHHAAVIVADEGALDGALEPEAFAEVGLLHSVNLTGGWRRCARHRAPAAPPDHRQSRPACLWGPRRSPRRGSLAAAARTSAPTCCSAWFAPTARRAPRHLPAARPRAPARAWSPPSAPGSPHCP